MTDTITLTGTIATSLKRLSTSSGISLVTFRLASSQRRYDRAKSVWIEADTNWYSVSVFRQLADHAAVSLSKGDRVFVSGRLRIRSWQKDDRSGTTVEIDAEAIGPDLLFGTTTFTRAAVRPSAVPENGAGARVAGLPGAQDPHGPVPAQASDPAPGPASAEVVAEPSAGAADTPPIDAQPGWHVRDPEAPF